MAHQVYIITGVVDEATVKSQAERRAADKRYPERTMLHYHKYTERCNDKCGMFPSEEE